VNSRIDGDSRRRAGARLDSSYQNEVRSGETHLWTHPERRHEFKRVTERPKTRLTSVIWPTYR
jgi:hypothetical protein